MMSKLMKGLLAGAVMVAALAFGAKEAKATVLTSTAATAGVQLMTAAVNTTGLLVKRCVLSGGLAAQVVPAAQFILLSDTTEIIRGTVETAKTVDLVLSGPTGFQEEVLIPAGTAFNIKANDGGLNATASAARIYCSVQKK